MKPAIKITKMRLNGICGRGLRTGGVISGSKRGFGRLSLMGYTLP